MPAFLKIEHIAPVMDSFIASLSAQEHSPVQHYPSTATVSSPQQVLHSTYATMACNRAIRSGEALTGEHVRILMQKAQDVDFCLHCPHGRPVLRKFQSSDVASWFLRL